MSKMSCGHTRDMLTAGGCIGCQNEINTAHYKISKSQKLQLKIEELEAKCQKLERQLEKCKEFVVNLEPSILATEHRLQRHELLKELENL